ncbi:MAG: hypothetical protein AB7O97_06450 [Planctomycetota bacterium]
MASSLQPPRSRFAPPRLDDQDLPAPPPEAPRRSFDLDPPARWRWLGLGIALAWPLTLVLPSMFSWVLCAIPHEMGHATVGCLLGHPSAPAISLRGEAWTGIAAQRGWLVWTMALLALGGGALCLRRRRTVAAIALGATALLLPALALSRAADVAITLGGHLGELAFATYCFALAWTGGRTDTPQERTAAAMAGAIVQARNVQLCFGLMTSPAARAHYAGNGSLGIKNDYLVLAQDLWHCRLETVAALMLLVALLPLPIGVLAGWLRTRAD